MKNFHSSRLFTSSGTRISVYAVVLSLLITASSFHSRIVEAAEAVPETLVTQFHETLLSTMKAAQSLGLKGRYERLKPAISQTFHLKAMIQIASGASWRKASEMEQSQLVDAFSRLTIATYATQFDGYSGQDFVTTGSKPGPQETTLVETILSDPTGTDVELVYVARLIKGKWQIIDVLLDTGISELARKRSEYRQVLKTEGISGLINTINTKTASLLAP